MRTILLLLFLILLPAERAFPVTPDLYTGEAAVADQGEAERRSALPKALEQVLSRQSGLRGFEDFPVVEPALQRASSIVLSFHYRSVEILGADGSSEEETRLVARFSAREVDELMRSLQLPLWRPERNPVETWLVIDDGQGRRVFPVELDYARQSLARVAERRALPLTWPQPDEDGEFPVDLQLLWGGYTEELVGDDGKAAMILAARREGPMWSVRTNLAYGEENWAWRLQDIDLLSVLDESMEQAIDRIASASTIAAEDLGIWVHRLKVTGLRGRGDYERCLDYLQGISTVNHVAVASARSPSVDFRLELNALPRYLEENIEGDGVLEATGVEGEYRLLGRANNER
ncbi:MAG: DUF2066 domain-containing protein [Xanthomonadales bacterium]|nr:DUF2066 domain-containing protein [Gammaproteobacteria bacterium]NNJ65709.1 DUF2066 domain-containing protein [Xanthomonadales bacterium]NNK37706.1 DUF2066 domain-containing protein [Xanthomonadales bacterium]